MILQNKLVGGGERKLLIIIRNDSEVYERHIYLGTLLKDAFMLMSPNLQTVEKRPDVLRFEGGCSSAKDKNAPNTWGSRRILLSISLCFGLILPRLLSFYFLYLRARLRPIDVNRQRYRASA